MCVCLCVFVGVSFRLAVHSSLLNVRITLHAQSRVRMPSTLSSRLSHCGCAGAPSSLTVSVDPWVPPEEPLDAKGKPKGKPAPAKVRVAHPCCMLLDSFPFELFWFALIFIRFVCYAVFRTLLHSSVLLSPPRLLSCRSMFCIHHARILSSQGKKDAEEPAPDPSGTILVKAGTVLPGITLQCVTSAPSTSTNSDGITWAPVAGADEEVPIAAGESGRTISTQLFAIALGSHPTVLIAYCFLQLLEPCFFVVEYRTIVFTLQFDQYDASQMRMTLV